MLLSEDSPASVFFWPMALSCFHSSPIRFCWDSLFGKNHPPVVTQISLYNTPIKAYQSHVVKHKNTATHYDFKAIPAERQRQICACQGSPGLPISHTEGCRKIGKKTFFFGSVLNKEIPLIYPINPNNPKILLWSFSWKRDKKPSNFGYPIFKQTLVI